MVSFVACVLLVSGAIAISIVEFLALTGLAQIVDDYEREKGTVVVSVVSTETPLARYKKKRGARLGCCRGRNTAVKCDVASGVKKEMKIIDLTKDHQNDEDESLVDPLLLSAIGTQ